MHSLRSSAKSVWTMNRFFTHLAVVFLVCNIVAAQTASTPSLSDLVAGEMEAEGVSTAFYDAEGNLKALLYGRHSKVLKNEVVDITDLRIDVYQDGKIDAAIYAPQCLVHFVKRGEETILVAESDGEVLVELEGLTIVGRGFRFRSDQNRFEILKDAKVIVEESARESTELEL